MPKKLLRALACILVLDSLLALALTSVLRTVLGGLGMPNYGSFLENYAYALAWAGIYSGALYVQHKYDRR